MRKMASITVVGGPRVRSGETCGTTADPSELPFSSYGSEKGCSAAGNDRKKLTLLRATSFRVVGGFLTSQSRMAALSIALSRGASDISLREMSSVCSEGTG